MKEFNNATKDQLVSAIENCIVGKNAERNRKILYRRLIDGICYEPLSEEFSLSVRQTKAIVYKCERVLFNKMYGLK